MNNDFDNLGKPSFGATWGQMALKEIDLIEGCISRMSESSFRVKECTVAAMSVFASVSMLEKGQQANHLVMLTFAILLSSCLWLLDAYYYWTEIGYRKLYSSIRVQRIAGDSTDILSLDSTPYRGGSLEYLRCLLSWPSMLLFYPAIIVGLILVFWLS